MEKLKYTGRLRHLILAVCIGAIITCSFSAYADRTEKSIADGIIRLHVIANSDSTEDQNLKLQVRDEIIKKAGAFLKDNDDKDVAIKEIGLKTKDIEDIAKKVVASLDYDYDVTVELGKSDFPTKSYGDVTLPAGTYDALKVIIGSGKGQNWWCVLFPPLCFVDATTADMPEDSMEMLKKSLTEDEYQMIMDSGEMPVKVKFKMYEMWQSNKLKLKNMFAKK